MAGRVARGDIRLYHFAPPDKKQPVLVLTRDSAIAYLSTVTVAPIALPFRSLAISVDGSWTGHRIGKFIFGR